MSNPDDDITPTPTAPDIERFQKAYSAILDGKVESRLRQVKFGDSVTAAIVVSRATGKGKERVMPLFIAVNDELLAHLSTMWGDPMARPTPPVREEPKLREADAESDPEPPVEDADDEV